MIDTRQRPAASIQAWNTSVLASAIIIELMNAQLSISLSSSCASTLLRLMRLSPRLLAAPAPPPPASAFQSLPVAILPPLPLYRRLLRAHRQFLPPDMRILGDQYIKSEFRLHKNVENPMHIVRLPLPGADGLLDPANEWALTDRVLDRMANVCATSGRRSVERRQDRQSKDR